MNQKWSSTSGSTLLLHVLAPSSRILFFKFTKNAQKWLKTLKSELGFGMVEAVNDANGWGLGCLNRVKNLEIRVSLW